MNTQPIHVFENTEINTDENCCPICLSDMTLNHYTIEECNHKFHINCLFQWFRTSNNTSCPTCRNIKESEDKMWYEKKHTFKLISQYARRKTADKSIVKMMTKYNTQNKELKQYKLELKNYKNTNKEILKEHNRLHQLVYKKEWKLEKLKREISHIPIYPLRL